MAMLLVSPAGAGGVRITFGLKSLVADVTAWGLPSSTDYTFTLDASGIASVVCTNYGGNKAPGQNYPHVDGTDTGDVPQAPTKNGKVTLSLEAVPFLEENPDISWDAGGCPNANWSARVDFVYWQTAVVQIVDTSTGKTTTYQYTCVTTRTGPNSTPSTFDDGAVSCTRVN